MLRNWKECPAPGKKRKAPKPLLGVWKTRSVFWDLAYWPILETPNSLDSMHITKNIFESLFGTVLNMPEKTKDGPKARNDLKILKLRGEFGGGRPRKERNEDSDMETGEEDKKGKKKEHY